MSNEEQDVEISYFVDKNVDRREIQNKLRMSIQIDIEKANFLKNLFKIEKNIMDSIKDEKQNIHKVKRVFDSNNIWVSQNDINNQIDQQQFKSEKQNQKFLFRQSVQQKIQDQIEQLDTNSKMQQRRKALDITNLHNNTIQLKQKLEEIEKKGQVKKKRVKSSLNWLKEAEISVKKKPLQKSDSQNQSNQQIIEEQEQIQKIELDIQIDTTHQHNHQTEQAHKHTHQTEQANQHREPYSRFPNIHKQQNQNQNLNSDSSNEIIKGPRGLQTIQTLEKMKEKSENDKSRLLENLKLAKQHKKKWAHFQTVKLKFRNTLKNLQAFYKDNKIQISSKMKQLLENTFKVLYDEEENNEDKEKKQQNDFNDKNIDTSIQKELEILEEFLEQQRSNLEAYDEEHVPQQLYKPKGLSHQQICQRFLKELWLLIKIILEAKIYQKSHENMDETKQDILIMEKTQDIIEKEFSIAEKKLIQIFGIK